MNNKLIQKNETGITPHVLTIKSNLKVYDILNSIINKKSSAILQWIGEKDLQLNNIVIVGAYLTGLGIANLLNTQYENITIIDIYPHLQELSYKFPTIQNNGERNLLNKINFSSDMNLIKTADCVIDTSGLGGLSLKQTGSISPKVFIIEDPIAEENDRLLAEENNVNERFKAVKSLHKAILKTNGLNTKTSGTMTLTIDVLLKSVNHVLKEPGVLYGISELTFFEGLIFKEKNIQKFLNRIDSPAITISTLSPHDLDKIIKLFLDKINSNMIG